MSNMTNFKLKNVHRYTYTEIFQQSNSDYL